MSIKKAVILAGGRGSRLYPSTLAVSKQLLPVWDKPMIYYPLSMLMLGDIKEVRIICSPENIEQFKLIGDGSNLGMNISYSIQPEPKGIAESLLHLDNFLEENEKFCLMLGDNIFFGKNNWFIDAVTRPSDAVIFGYPVEDPRSYGVVTLNKNNEVLSIEEKPDAPTSKLAIPGIYIFDESCIRYIREEQTPSARGEYEVTDIMHWYNKQNKLTVKQIGIGVTWFDTGTPLSLFECSNFIKTIENNHGIKIGCIEEIALNRKFIDSDQFAQLIASYPNSEYKEYLQKKLRAYITNEMID